MLNQTETIRYSRNVSNRKATEFRTINLINHDSQLEQYFASFRQKIVGIHHQHNFHGGRLPITYADWTASGRLYEPIERYMTDTLGPFVANTHTEATLTGTTMTQAYRQARALIKAHVGATEDDVLLFAGFGMTAAINKFQRILGLRIAERFTNLIQVPDEERPLVIVTHMEHHSNQTTWLECLCDVQILNRGDDGLPDLNHLVDILKAHQHRKYLIGSFTACSNVTGLLTPYHEMAELMHRYGGVCFVDFASSAPYVAINMHPPKSEQKLDGIFFSPHKFLGGPGSSGVVLFDKDLYRNQVPDHPGGGTVAWTNPWGEHQYYDDIETREDGGTPGFLPAIRASLSILLKEEMGINQILEREHELVDRMWRRLDRIAGIEVLEPSQRQRLGIFSLYAPDIHHNLFVNLLNDYYGIQARGGCSCAGTYGHVLLDIDANHSRSITNQINQGDFSLKPGWIRLSLHPTTTQAEIDYIADALEDILANHRQLGTAYKFDSKTGDFSGSHHSKKLIDLQASFQAIDRIDSGDSMRQKTPTGVKDRFLNEAHEKWPRKPWNQFGYRFKDLEIYGRQADYEVINEREVRAAAGIKLAIIAPAVAIAFFTHNYLPLKIVVVLVAIDFLIRLVTGLTPFSPIGVLARFLVRKQQPEWVGADQKRFAWSLGFVMAINSLSLLFTGNAGILTKIFCGICITLMWMSASFGICPGCSLYNWAIKLRLIPEPNSRPACPGGACEISLHKSVKHRRRRGRRSRILARLYPNPKDLT